MSQDPSSVLAPAKPLRFLRALLATLIFLSATWQAVRLSAELLRRFGSGSAWATAAAALPFLAMSITGAFALLRGDRRRCHWIWLPALLSLFRWPVPDFPTQLGLHIAFPLQRLLNGMVALSVLIACRYLPQSSEGGLEASPRIRIGLVVATTVAVLAGSLGIRLFVDRAAAAMVEEANEAYEAGRSEDAIALWSQVRRDFPQTRAEGMALFNTSYAYRHQERWEEAIPLLKELLGGDLDDTDPTRQLMNPYQNYHNRACLGLVDCYEHLGDYPSALRYAKLARDVYPYRSWCGTCLWDARSSVNRKIARLEAKVAGTESPTTAAAIRYEAGDEGKPLCLAFGPEGRTLSAGMSGGTVKTWDVASGMVVIGFLQDSPDEIEVMALAPDGKTVASWGDGKISVQRVGDDRKPTVLMVKAGKGHSLAFSPEGRTLAAGGDGWVAIWDTDTARQKARVGDQGGWIGSIAFAPDGRTLAYGVWLDSRDNRIKLWNVDDANEPTVLHRDSSAVYGLAFSPDGKTLACGNQRGGAVELWNVPAGRQLPALSGHSHNVVSVAFSPDGKMLVSGGVDNTINIWNLALGQTVRSIKTDKADILVAAPDGRNFASINQRERTPRVWDLETGKERFRLATGRAAEDD